MDTPESPAPVTRHVVKLPQTIRSFKPKRLPTDLLTMLSEPYQQIVFDGFTADVKTENPYGYGVNKPETERMSFVLWNRGHAFRELGYSLKVALLVED